MSPLASECDWSGFPGAISRSRSAPFFWIALERGSFAGSVPETRKDMLKRLDDIENAVNAMKMPLAFADQFYVLREHIRFVRDRLTSSPAE